LFERLNYLVKVGLVHGKFVAAASIPRRKAADRPEGEDAPIRAAQRADELLADGDMEGSAVWRRILEAIEELQRSRRDGDALN
jgi:hypothetical protein